MVCLAGQITKVVPCVVQSHTVRVLVVTPVMDCRVPVHAGLTPDSDFMTACMLYIILQAQCT